MIHKKKLLSSLIIASSLMACNPVSLPSTLPTNPASSTEPTEPSEEPSAEPGDTPAPNSSSDPSALPAPNPSASTTPTGDAPAVSEPGDGKIMISGANTFDAYSVDFKVGMKWVYSMKNEIATPQINLPTGLPAGIQIPGFGINSFTDLGSLTMEVTNVTGNTVTIKTTTDISIPGAPPVEPQESTFDKSKGLSAMYSEQLASGQEGTLNFSKVGSGESVSVKAGSYTADRIKALMKVTVDASGASVDFDQESMIWITSGVGMVKQETKSSIDSSGVAVETTTLIELTSFKG